MQSNVNTRRPITVQLSKNNGAPHAVVQMSETASLADMQAALKAIFVDKNALKSVGLRFCEGCKSGLDILIRTEYEEVINVQLPA